MASTYTLTRMFRCTASGVTAGQATGQVIYAPYKNKKRRVPRVCRFHSLANIITCCLAKRESKQRCLYPHDPKKYHPSTTGSERTGRRRGIAAVLRTSSPPSLKDALKSRPRHSRHQPTTRNQSRLPTRMRCLFCTRARLFPALEISLHPSQ